MPIIIMYVLHASFICCYLRVVPAAAAAIVGRTLSDSSASAKYLPCCFDTAGYAKDTHYHTFWHYQLLQPPGAIRLEG